MMNAAMLSVRMGLLDPAVIGRQQRIFDAYGLPTTASDLDRAAIMDAILLDKKVQGKKVRWVLLEGIGRPVLRDDVPQEVVDSVLDELLG
jgi:3-dehydroquinate synthase